MEKDYDVWHRKKSRLNNIAKPPFFREREIWFCHLGANIGIEEDGRGSDFLRPAVIIRQFNHDASWVIPLTRKKGETRHYFELLSDSRGPSFAILSQIRLIDARRLSYRIGVLSEEQFLKLKENLKALLP